MVRCPLPLTVEFPAATTPGRLPRLGVTIDLTIVWGPSVWRRVPRRHSSSARPLVHTLPNSLGLARGLLFPFVDCGLSALCAAKWHEGVGVSTEMPTSTMQRARGFEPPASASQRHDCDITSRASNWPLDQSSAPWEVVDRNCAVAILGLTGLTCARLLQCEKYSRVRATLVPNPCGRALWLQQGSPCKTRVCMQSPLVSRGLTRERPRRAK